MGLVVNFQNCIATKPLPTAIANEVLAYYSAYAGAVTSYFVLPKALHGFESSSAAATLVWSHI
jgi:hypothetical protein